MRASHSFDVNCCFDHFIFLYCSLPREAMTTAEPPEPLAFSAFRIHFIQTISSAD
jgi:hypothetical protein